MIKDILVGLSLGNPRDAAADYAASVAEAFGAHLAGVALTHDIIVPPDLVSAMPLGFIDEQRTVMNDQAAAAIAKFDEIARRAGLSAESHILDARATNVARLFALAARRFDLAVLSQADPDRSVQQELIIEAALFESGRPVIVVPRAHRQRLALDRVAVCWDGSRAAARALADAMPLLERTKAVELVTVATEPAKSDELPAADIGQHLARHGLAVDVRNIVTPNVSAPRAILSYAADSSADFIVMGGFGHSRLREFVLGGVTRAMLTSLPAPTLMSH
jgi:nucleotide-binding universal stress UspA family protein